MNNFELNDLEKLSTEELQVNNANRPYVANLEKPKEDLDKKD